MTALEVDADQILDRARATIPVLVPWRTDNGSRAANWAIVEERMWEGWAFLNEGAGPDGPFNRSAAINEAAAAVLPYAEHVVVADADSVVDPAQLAAAIDLSERTGSLVVAHDRWLNVEVHEIPGFLTAGRVRDEEWVTHPVGRRTARMRYRNTVSSMLVIPTALWDAVGGFDDRFVGWGSEDMAFHRMCEVFGAVDRVPGPCHHLSHERPKAERMRSADRLYVANRALWRKYRNAGTNREALADVRWPGGRP